MAAIPPQFNKKSRTMIRASQHEDTRIILQSIYLVEEVGSRLGCDETIYVFEDKETRRSASGFLEDRADRVFRVEHAEGFDVESRDRVWAVAESLHHCFDRYGFTITGGPVEYNTALMGVRKKRPLLRVIGRIARDGESRKTTT